MADEQKLNCGCFSSRLPSTPRPITSKYLSDVSASFAINTKAKNGDESPSLSAHFSWLVDLKRPLPEGAFMEAHFPDPSISGDIYRVPMMKIKNDNQEMEK
jgi:hypothetical protein